jgi:uncharacterized membrane protein
VDARCDRGKYPVSAVLAGPYGHPFHPILVTVPIGAWAASLAFDVASHVVSRPGFLTAGSTWLIGIGVVGAVAAGLVGFLDLVAIPTGTPAFRTGLVHMGLNIVITVAYGLDLAWRVAGSVPTDPFTPVAVGPLLLSLVCFAALGLSGSLGGRLAYRYGVRVVDEATQAEGFVQRSADAPAADRAG